MKNLMILTLAVAVLALSVPTYAYVAYRGGGGYHATDNTYHATSSANAYHAGYSCGGVYTGTTVAHGTTTFVAGAAVQPGMVVAAPVYMTPGYSYGGGYVSPPPPPPLPPVNSPQPGTIVYNLSASAQPQVVNGLTYYVLGNVYYQQFFGSNGVYYQVVAGPPPG